MTKEKQEQSMSPREIERRLRSQVSDKEIERWAYKSAPKPHVKWKSRSIGLITKLFHPLAYNKFRSLEPAEGVWDEFVTGRSSVVKDWNFGPPYPEELDYIVMTKFAIDFAKKEIRKYETRLGLPSNPREDYHSRHFDELISNQYPEGCRGNSYFFNRG